MIRRSKFLALTLCILLASCGGDTSNIDLVKGLAVQLLEQHFSRAQQSGSIPTVDRFTEALNPESYCSVAGAKCDEALKGVLHNAWPSHDQLQAIATEVLVGFISKASEYGGQAIVDGKISQSHRDQFLSLVAALAPAYLDLTERAFTATDYCTGNFRQECHLALARFAEQFSALGESDPTLASIFRARDSVAKSFAQQYGRRPADVREGEILIFKKGEQAFFHNGGIASFRGCPSARSSFYCRPDPAGQRRGSARLI